MELIKMGGAIGFIDPSPTSNGGYEQQTSTKEYIRRDGSVKDHGELYRPQVLRKRAWVMTRWEGGYTSTPSVK